MSHPVNAPPTPSKPRHPLEQRPAPPRQPQPEFQPARQPIALPQSQPILAYALLGLNVMVFIADFAYSGRLTDQGEKVNASIVAGQYWRFFTPMFLHAGLLHLGMNSYSLYIVGRSVERLYGSWRFAAIYFISGVAGAVFSFALTPAKSVGASGAIFGLIGALLPFLYRNRHILSSARSHINNILMIIGMNLAFGLFAGFIDNWAHIGGLLCGLALGWFVTPLFKVVHDDMTQTIRIVDEAPGQTIWAAIVLAALLVSGLAYGLAVLRSLG